MRLFVYLLDALGTAGVVGGVALWSYPAALLVAGLFALVWAFVLERRL